VSLFFKIVFRTILLLAVAFCVLVVYLNVHGFPPFLERLVVEQIARAGIAAKFKSIRVDFARGIVATDAVLSDARAPDQTLAQIDEVQLQINWPRLINQQNGIDALVIANATLSIPTPSDEIGPQHFAASEAFATFKFEDDGTIQIDRLTGVYAGIGLHVTGSVKPRAATPPTQPKLREPGRSPAGFITKTLRELNSLRATTPPQIDLDFSLDLDQPLAGMVRAKLRGADLRYRDLNVQKAAIDLEMHDGAIQIPHATLNLNGGEISLSGRYDVAGGQFDLKLSSTTDPTALAAAFPVEPAKMLRELRFRRNPTITARYWLAPETGSVPQLEARIETGPFEFRRVRFRSVDASIAQKGPEIRVTQAKIITPEGKLTGHGQYHFESSDFSYELDSTVDPRKMLPLMTQNMRLVVEPSWFETPPHIVANVSGDFVDPDAFAYDAEIATGECSYRGVSMHSASGNLKLRNSVLDARDIVLTRDEGELRGSVLADFKQRRLGFDIETTANPSQMAPLLGPRAARVMREYRFGPRTKGHAQGIADFEDPGGSAWTAQVSNEGFSYWKFTADRASAELTFTNNTMRIDNFDSDFYGGKLRGQAQFEFDEEETNGVTYAFDLETERCDVRRMLEALHGARGETSGLLTGRATLRGIGSDLRTLTGRGNLEITDGVLWEVPLFGIFSHILNEIGPNLGTTKVTDARASFTVKNLAVRTDDLRVSAGAVSITSHGKVGFDGKLDFRLKGQLLRAVPGINFLTWFLSNVFEYKIGGTLSDPDYRAANLPKELLPHD
jgi:hypothetical protein